jgi:hypothetical protein
LQKSYLPSCLLRIKVYSPTTMGMPTQDLLDGYPVPLSLGFKDLLAEL